MGFTQTEILNKFNLVIGNYMILQEPLYFESSVWGQIKTQTGTDGISDPESLQFFLQKFGKYVASGILHDGGYKNNLWNLKDDGSWVRLTLTEKQANQLIDEALKSQGCSWIEREIIYDALQLFSWKAFDDDRFVPSNPAITVTVTSPKYSTEITTA